MRLLAAGHQPCHQPRGLRRRRGRHRRRRRADVAHPDRSNSSKKLGLGVPVSKSYFSHYEFTSQFEGAERIADKWGVTRSDCDEFGLASQQRAAQAWAEGRFDSQVVEVDAPDVDDEGKPTGTTHHVTRDGGLRETTLEGLAGLKPVARPDGVHTAGSSSQISDGAAAVLVMTADKAAALGLTPRARVVDTCLVGVDPCHAHRADRRHQRLLARTGMTIDDIDVAEVNEAFASVVLAWAREVGADLERTNPNGGAIALGHPLGATGAVLSSPRPSTSSSGPTSPRRWCRCAAAAAPARAPSSSASDLTRRRPWRAPVRSLGSPLGAMPGAVRSTEAAGGPIGPCGLLPARPRASRHGAAR